VLITGRDAFPKQKEFMDMLLKRHPEITTVVQNINSSKTSYVLGDREKILYGSGNIIDVLCGKRFIVSPRSFYQVNPYQAEVLYDTALKMAKLTKNEVLLDAYSGVGTIGIIASSHVKRVLSVEIEEDAVKDAIRNAKINSVENIRFNHQDATKLMIDMARHGGKLDVVLLDPPRRGSGDLFMAAIVALQVPKVIYISCNPVTQAQDIVKLLENGYVVTGIQPVDMFPHTSHVENIMLLEHK
jgi:23S rRNA (uracil1939-C5)-methyltransferase